MSARGFLRRWNTRVMLAEWRQYAVIFAMMLLGVALSIGGVLAAYNLVEPPESEFGNGTHSSWTDGDPELMAAALEGGGHSFGRIDSATLVVTGSAQRVDARAVDAKNEITEPLVSLLEGRLPTTPGEVAVTDRAVVDIDAVNAPMSLAGQAVTVVGIVENPTRLDDEFVLVTTFDRFEVGEISTRFLIDANPDSVQYPGVRSVSTSTSGGPSARTAVTMVVNVMSALGLLEIGLLVSAGFAVIARRRMRQFGLLAAAGATPKQLRSAATGMGLLLGAVAALAGALVGFVLAWTLMPRMEGAVGHRIDFGVPWWAVIINVLVAIAVAGAAARWPARSLSLQPVANLLSAQRPRPASVGRPALVGVGIAAAGAVALAAGFAKLNIYLAVLGVLLAPIGLLLMAPLLVRSLAGVASSLSLAPRLGGRAVARHNRRSAAVVAALALALAIPIALTVVTSSIDARRTNEGANVADEWFVAWQPGADDGTTRIPAELDTALLAATHDRMAAAAPDLELIPIEVAVVPGGPREMWDFDTIGSQQSIAPLMAGRRGSTNCLTCDSYGFGETDEAGEEIVWIVDHAWIATPQLLSTLAVDPTLVADGATAVAATNDLRVIGDNGVVDGSVVVAPAWPQHSRIPKLLVAEAVADDRGAERVTIGLLAASTSPVTAETRDLVRNAVGPDLVLEFHQPPEPQSGLRAAALAIGMTLGLGIAMAAVSLFAAELTDDLTVLRSIGAPPRTTRRLSAAVAAVVASAGAVLALLIGYVALIPLITAKDIDFPFVVPWRALLALLILFPLLAAGAGWLSGDRFRSMSRSATT